MATFDVRNEGTEEIHPTINRIIFDDEKNYEGLSQMYVVSLISNKVSIHDAFSCMFVESKNHALNLIKALNKAIELGWVK